MTRDERDEFVKVLCAHRDTVEICEACALTTRDLAAEVKRGGEPSPHDLQRSVEQAEAVLRQLADVREEIRRLLVAYS